MTKRLMVVVMIVVAAAAMSGCVRVIETSGFDTGLSPVYDSALNPGFSNQSPTLCIERPTINTNRGEDCRVIRGYEDGPGNWPDDDRNWVISFDGGIFDEGPMAYWANPDNNPHYREHPWFACPNTLNYNPYGCGIILKTGGFADDSPVNAPGWIFWGCEFSREGNDYACDYRERYKKLMQHPDADFPYYLRKTINWVLWEVAKPLNCARSLYEAPVSPDLLTDCSDGPWNGSVDGGALLPQLAPGETPDPLGDVPENDGVPQEMMEWTSVPNGADIP